MANLLKLFLTSFLLCVCCYSDTIVQSPDASDTVQIVKNLQWSLLDSAYILTPLKPSRISCLQVINHNPFNAHQLTLAVSGTYDKSNKKYTSNTNNWFSVSINYNADNFGTTASSFTLQVAETRLFYLNTRNAVNLAVSIGASGLAGSPDTIDVFFSSNCEQEFPLYTSNLYTGTLAVVAGGTTTLVFSLGCCDNYIHVTHFDISVPFATALSGFVGFQEGAGVNCATGLSNIYQISYPVSTIEPYNEGDSIHQIFHTITPNDALCVTNTTDQALRVNITYYISKDIHN